ncbi:MAG: hypothetical protein ACLFTR_04885 [Candidatus Woesearchaeota archaeon]
MRIGHDAGVVTPIMISAIILTQFALESDISVLIVQAATISFTCFLVFTYSYTKSNGNSEIILLRVALAILFLDSIMITISSISSGILISLILTSMGIVLSFLDRRDQKNHQKREGGTKDDDKPRSITRKEDIERELADPWKEEPHILYDPYELEKFDI